MIKTIVTNSIKYETILHFTNQSFHWLPCPDNKYGTILNKNGINKNKTFSNNSFLLSAIFPL